MTTTTAKLIGKNVVEIVRKGRTSFSPKTEELIKQLREEGVTIDLSNMYDSLNEKDEKNVE